MLNLLSRARGGNRDAGLSGQVGRLRQKVVLAVVLVVDLVTMVSVLALLAGLVAGLQAVFAEHQHSPQSSSPPRTHVDDPNPPHEVKGGWGPSRPVFTMHDPSPMVTLNSITDNPDHGDERNFFNVKPAGDPRAFSDRLNVYGLHRYTASVFYSNSALPSGPAAVNTRVSLLFPSSMTGSTRLNAIVSADNAIPPVVWDSAVITLPKPDESADLRYVPGSARLHTGGKAHGATLGNEIFTDDGVLVGCDRLDGIVSGETRCEGWVTFDFILAQAHFTMEASIGTPGLNDYAGHQEIKPGGSVSVMMQYKNTGNVDQNDVVMGIAALPLCGSIAPGSTRIFDSGTAGKWVKIEQDIDVNNPINLGLYAPNGNAFLQFQVRFCDKDELSRQYEHSWSEGALWTKPYIKLYVETDNGTQVNDSLWVAVLAPAQG